MTGKDPKPHSKTSNLLFQYIRRENFDSFWSRASRTILNDLGQVTRSIQNLARVNLPGPYYDPDPAPPNDACGYELVIALLMDSQEKGIYHDDHKQWQSVQKLHTVILNNERASFRMTGVALIADNNSKKIRIQEGGTSSFWFNRFTQSCSSRMGADIQKNVRFCSAIWSKFFNSSL